MKKNLNKSIFSVLLAVAMLLSSLVISSYATEEPEKTSYSLPITTNTNTDQIIDYTQNTDQGLDTDELVPIYENDIVITEPGSAGEGVYEILSMRDENTKYISLGGGRYQAVSYMEAVHRKASDGSFVDIDNRISLVGDKYITPDSRVSFDKNNAGFTIDEEGYKISLELSVSDIDNKIDANENASLVEITNHEERTEDLSSLTALEKLERIRNVDNKSTLKYVSVNANTDVEYILASNDVKENIIVKNRADSYEYSFLLTLDALYAEENEDGSISLCDSESDENKYVIPAPYMYDANDVYSYDVDYELISVPDKDGIYILIVTADEEFINSDEREFPVVIDPTVIVKTPKIDVQDTYIDSNNPGYPYGYGSRLYVGSKITYIKTGLPNIPEGATLKSAKLYVPYYFDSAYKYGRADICANQMMNNWDEYTLTWNAASAMTNSPNGIYMGYKQSYSCLVSLNYSSIYPVYATFDITDFANTWYSGEAQNYGIALTKVSGDIDEAIIYSRESSGSHRCYMIYEYESAYIPNGVYAIKNVGDPTCYAMADATTPINAAVLKKGTYTTSPAIEFARSALFKISRVEGTDRYVIRSMLNNEYILAFTENEVVTKKANPNDMQVSEYDTFYIQYDSSRDGFIIKPYMSSYAMSMGYTSDNFVKAPATSIGMAVVWDFEIYTGDHQKGGNIYANPMYAGETGTLYPYVWSTVIGRNEVTVDVGYTNIVSPYWNQTDKILYLSGHDEGVVPITVNLKGYITNEYEVVFNTDYPVYLPFEEGTYFFKNGQLQNYMQIDNDDAPNYNSSEAILELFSFDGGTYQRWNVEHVYDGYYKIISYASGKVITAPSEKDASLTQKDYSVSNDQLWKITSAGSGMYKLNPKSDTSYYMAAGDGIFTSDGRNIEIRSSQSDNKDEWIICDFDTSLLLAIDDSDGYSRHTYFSATKNNLQTEKNGTISITSTVRYSSASIATMIGYLQSSNIFIVHTHGFQDGFKISNSGTTYITITDLAGQNLSNLSFALLMTCNTGVNYNPSNITNNTPVNIIEQMVICGAETVVGFKDITIVSDCNKFGPDITAKLISEGLSVYDAIDSITYTSYIKDMSSIAVVAGNGNNKLR